MVVRDHSAAAPPVASTTARAPIARPSSSTRPAPSSIASVAARRPSSTSIRGCSATTADSARRIRRPGRAPARVRDAADAVAALEAEREVAVAVGVEAHAERLEVAEALGRLVAQHLGGRAAHEPAPGGERVLEVALRRVVGGERGGQAALGPVGGGLARAGGRRSA